MFCRIRRGRGGGVRGYIYIYIYLWLDRGVVERRKR